MAELNKRFFAVRAFWPMLVIIGLAVNLRPPITAIGPLLDDIRMDTGLSVQAASMLTVLPMLCMGLFPLLLPFVERRLSESVWISTGLFTIATASFSRFWMTDGFGLIVTAMLAGIGIAIVQTLTPGVVKRWYPQSVPLAMGGYSASLMAGGGLVAILSPQVAHYSENWQTGLGVWIVPALIAALLWWLKPREVLETHDKSVPVNFWGNRRAWLLASYFGLANGVYASMITWLPTFAQSLGWNAENSGKLIGIMTVFQVIAAVVAPALSSGRLDRRLWLFFAVGIQFAGLSGLMLMPEAMLVVWVAMIGCGLGACFALTLTVALDHLSAPRLAGALTAFVQGIGFIITAMTPYLVSLLFEWTGTFQTSWFMLSLTLVMMLLVTFQFSPSSYARAMNIS
ncbi:CynX/NimT family MFS transporter [Photobacterium sp. CCB-ST2H9]|uniref:CynX/NimT family MFS transporter n=1 Tax=Photobacterium sp. CCB-ST2H9 TaxID=2912855 RepID=UPI0020058386|nr:CynX/NimT family MFS transporter [Photobacterium sp. CCB-ST2H9]UTM60184.1 CynX/NimT family MFS transporter [Photobacterium sp. CCB-ST2H9]